MMRNAEQLSDLVGVSTACALLGVPRSSLYYSRRQAQRASAATPPVAQPRPTPPRALSQAERAEVRDLLNSERFRNLAPREVYAELLDEQQRYYCSVSTMYRILEEHQEVRERRNQLRHPAHRKPELVATDANQVYSWDITKLRGASKGQYYYLYVMLDIYSRYVVGWLIAEVESAVLAEQLIAETCAKQGIQRDQLTIHADNGSPMIAKSVAMLLADLGVGKSHSRPRVSNDNPFSEAQFKTLKYHADYPERFGSLADARSWGRSFFAWYNDRHHHTDLGLLTPADVHHGRTETVCERRQEALLRAYRAYPEQFVKGVPAPKRPPEAVWINRPLDQPALLPSSVAVAVEQRAVVGAAMSMAGAGDRSAFRPVTAPVHLDH